MLHCIWHAIIWYRCSRIKRGMDDHGFHSIHTATYSLVKKPRNGEVSTCVTICTYMALVFYVLLVDTVA